MSFRHPSRPVRLGLVASAGALAWAGVPAGAQTEPAAVPAPDAAPPSIDWVWHDGPAPAPTQRPATDPELADGELPAAPPWRDGLVPTPIQRPAVVPEVPDGVAPSARVAAKAALSDCDPGRYCAWTGGYFTGPSINFIVKYSVNWGNYSEPQCASSGTSGPNWKNCASSLRNSNQAYNAHFFSGGSGSGNHLVVGPGSSRDQLGSFNNTIESSTS